MADFIRHLCAVNEKMAQDTNLNSTHISLYIALFHLWNSIYWKQPLSISRSETMRLSKIGSPKTYLKCLKELDSGGYIKYQPSKNPLKGSLVYMVDFTTTWEQVRNKAKAPKESSREQVVAPPKNRSKIKKTNKKEVPALDLVKKWFSENNASAEEAERFFLHYEALGWKSGATAIVNWENMATKWLLTPKKEA